MQTIPNYWILIYHPLNNPGYLYFINKLTTQTDTDNCWLTAQSRHDFIITRNILHYSTIIIFTIRWHQFPHHSQHITSATHHGSWFHHRHPYMYLIFTPNSSQNLVTILLTSNPQPTDTVNHIIYSQTGRSATYHIIKSTIPPNTSYHIFYLENQSYTPNRFRQQF